MPKTFVSTLRLDSKILASLYLANRSLDIDIKTISALVNNSLEEYLKIILELDISPRIISEDEAQRILSNAGLHTKRSSSSNTSILRKALQEESMSGDSLREYLSNPRITKENRNRLKKNSPKVLEALKNLKIK